MAHVLADHPSQSGNVAPLVRVRLLECLRAAAEFPVALLIAPAGYGKSVLLRHYLESTQKPSVRFTLRAEHGEFLGFLRGFAEAIGEHAPHAITSLAGAYERNQTSPRRPDDLARWMQAHVEDSFGGIIAIDDLHHGENDTDIARFITAMIELCKEKISWILASRSTAGLPVGSWVAYQNAVLPIGEADLRFTLAEAIVAAGDAGLRIGQNEISNLLQITEGWPAALAFALMTSTRSSDLRNVSSATREMTYRFLAEQVYNTLTDDERDLLEVAIALPNIDIAVLERAGFDRALQIVEGLHERTAFISEDSSNVYRCHDLFRDFLRHQSALRGKQAQRTVNERAARALEGSGDIEHAIAAYASAGSKDDLVRLLEAHGFDLLERAQSDVVSKAIDALDEAMVQSNAYVQGLIGSMQASAGRIPRAESLLKRALVQAKENKRLAAVISLRLATLYGNAGVDVVDLLEPIANDELGNADVRAEATSLMVAKRVLAGKRDYLRYVSQIETLLPDITSETTRVKVLHHLGIVQRHTGNLRHAVLTLHRASDLSKDLHMYAIAARVNAVLSNLVLQEYDDDVSQLKYSEAACEDAARAGDIPTLRTALLQKLSAHIRKGDDQAIQLALNRLSDIPLDEAANELIMFFRAVSVSWQGKFREAHTLMTVCWKNLYLDIDRISAGSQLALFLASDDKRDESSNISAQVRCLLPTVMDIGPFRSRTIALSVAYLAVAESLNGRLTLARRILRTIKTNDCVESAARLAAEVFLKAFRENDFGEVRVPLGRLEMAGYWDASRMLGAVCRVMEQRVRPVEVFAALTAAEVEVLRMLDHGMVAKEIAIDTGRSLNTVRAHIARAVQKLNCNRQSDALKEARRMGLL